MVLPVERATSTARSTGAGATAAGTGAAVTGAATSGGVATGAADRAASALRSTFPFADSGSASTTRTRCGTMYPGSRAASSARSASAQSCASSAGSEAEAGAPEGRPPTRVCSTLWSSSNRNSALSGSACTSPIGQSPRRQSAAR